MQSYFGGSFLSKQGMALRRKAKERYFFDGGETAIEEIT